MRLAWNEKKIDEKSGSVADTNDVRAKSASRTAQCLGLDRGVAIESRTQLAGLLARAPDAF